MLRFGVKQYTNINRSTFLLRKYSTTRVLLTGMRAVQVSDPSTGSLCLAEVPKPVLREHEVLVKVHSTAVNRADILQKTGKYPPPKGESEILGLEAAGEIVEIHPSCSSKLNIGSKVMALLAGGGYAEYVNVNHRHVMPIPKSISMTEAGGVAEVWLTAYQLLYHIGNLKSTDTVLIHAGASGVGTAAIQLVKMQGATSLVTAGSDSKLNFARSLGASAAYNYKTEEWETKVKEFTNGKGVSVVLDCVGAPYWEKNLSALAVDGRWILYGLLGGMASVDGTLFAKLLGKRITLTASTLRSRSIEYKAELVESFERDVIPRFDDLSLKPIIDTVFELDDAQKAHEHVESNKTQGKTILKVLTEST